MVLSSNSLRECTNIRCRTVSTYPDFAVAALGREYIEFSESIRKAPEPREQFAVRPESSFLNKENWANSECPLRHLAWKKWLFERRHALLLLARRSSYG